MNILGKPPNRHVQREANGAIDWMAKHANVFIYLFICNKLTIYDQPPCWSFDSVIF